MNILLAPHNDDEALFAGYIIQRYKPLVVVVTDSFIQFERGLDVTAHQRRAESRMGCGVLGVDVKFMGLADDCSTYAVVFSIVEYFLEGRLPFANIFMPAGQGGNEMHDLVGEAVFAIDWNWRGCGLISYATYAKDQFYTPIDGVEIVPTPEEVELKEKALACYKSQHFQPHFAAVKGQSEWLSRLP